MNVVKTHGYDWVTFILVCETTWINGVGPSLAHMFASNSQPKSVVTILEFSFS